MNQEIQVPLERKSSVKLNKQAYLTSLLSEQENQPQKKSQLHEQQQRVQFLEEATIHPSPTADQIYKEHRDFLENYKRQRQRQREAQTSQQSNPLEVVRKQHRRSASTTEHGAPSKQSQDLVMQRLASIQEKLAQEIVSQRVYNERPPFKLFADVVENKNDIQRVSKERRFLRSQQSKYYEYNEPAMPPRSKLPPGLRVRTEGILDQVQLGRNAKQFIEKVQKDQQRLLGKHLLRRKIEEGRRSNEEGLEGRRAIEEKDLKREERRLKAENNLLIIKEKIKLAKIIHRQPLEEQTSGKVKNFRHSLRGGKTTETEIKQRAQEKPKEASRMASDRLSGLKESQFNIKDRIAIRKHKVVRPTEYREPAEEQLKENRVKTEYSSGERVRVHSDVVTKMEGSRSEDQGDLPSNLLHNQFITMTQYEEGGEERASKFRKERNDIQSSLA